MPSLLAAALHSRRSRVLGVHLDGERKKCNTQEQGNGCPIGSTCRDFGGFCEPKLVLGPSQDEAIQVFQNGGMLPAGGSFYVATRGDQLLLRSKCGTQEMVAEIARPDLT